MSKLSENSFGWFAGMISLAVLIAFSSCSTNREASLAYMDDIYKPYDINYLLSYYNEQGDVSDQDASVIKPYRPIVPDYYPYAKPVNFRISFGYSYGSPYSYYNNGCGDFGRSFGYYPMNYNFGDYYYRPGCNTYAWYGLPYYGYYPYYNYNYGDYGGSSGGSYIYGNNVSYFNGINSSDRYKGSNGVNFSEYVYYRASGSNGLVNTGRQSGSSGKSRYANNLNNGKSNTDKSNNHNRSSDFKPVKIFKVSNSQNSRSGSSLSPSRSSRSSGSGGGSYTGKRPR